MRHQGLVYILFSVVRPKSKYFHDSACWVNKESLYYSFLSIVGLNLLYNLVIVILVSKRAILKEAKDVSGLCGNSLISSVFIGRWGHCAVSFSPFDFAF